MNFAKNISLIESKIGYTFKDKALLCQAFTRSSFCNEKNYGGKDNYSSNEVLEFFGDSVLSCAIITLLLRAKTERYSHGIKTNLTEGDFSNIRSKLSDKRNLSKNLSELGLQKYLLLGEGDEKLGISEEASVMEDLFESIIGAVYIDCGMNIETVIKVVSIMLDVSVYENGDAPIQSYKNALQEWCADKKRRLPSPVYKTVSESGPDHKKTYERGVFIGNKLYGVGEGKNQKLADTAAAEIALKALMEEEKSKKLSAKAAGSVGAARELGELASKKKLPSPEYHDLGEAPDSTESSKIYRVECCFMGHTATETGYSKQEARDAAGAKILKLISAAEATKAKMTESKFGLKNKVSAAQSKKTKKPEKQKQPSKKICTNKPAVKSTQSNPSPKKAPLHHTKRS